MRYKRKILERNAIGVLWVEWYEGKVGEPWIPPERILNTGDVVFDIVQVRDRGQTGEYSIAIGGIKNLSVYELGKPTVPIQGLTFSDECDSVGP